MISHERKAKTYRVGYGNSLSLEIPPTGNYRWRLRFMWNRKENQISLGTYPLISLKEARKRCNDYRRMLANGINPATHRKQNPRGSVI